MQGGGARQQGFTLFHQTITTGNTDKTHLLVLEADAPALCEASPAKKRINESDQFQGTERMCFLKMSASSLCADDGDVVCGGLAICWMLSSCWDCSLILGPELWNNPPPPSAPLSPSPSVCPEDRHPDSARSHYSLFYIKNNNNNKYCNHPHSYAYCFILIAGNTVL